jgi:hypothetical protein
MQALNHAELASGLDFAGRATPIPCIRSHVAQRHLRGMFESVAGSREVMELIELFYAALAGRARKADAAVAIRRTALEPAVALLYPVRIARPLMLQLP